MLISQSSIFNLKSTYYRLITLWVICEAMLGGIIHGFKLPVSGLLVGSCAIICICLIAWYVPQKGAILKATIIVAIFKMMLSPQAPPPAYIAVFFQGLLGELLFWNRKNFRLACIVLAVLGLLESGLQRILMLTIVYGNDFWKVVNSFFNNLVKQKKATNYSLIIGGAYVALHFVTGVFIGWWASVLPRRIEKWTSSGKYQLPAVTGEAGTLPVKAKKTKRFKLLLIIIWMVLIVLYVQSYFKIGTPLLPSHISLKILLRSLIIVLGWMFIIGPLLTRLLHSWLQKKQARSRQEVQEVLQLLPGMQRLIAQSWKRSKTKSGLSRLNYWSRLVLVNTLPDRSLAAIAAENAAPAARNDIASKVILTGPIQTGKTTSLQQWVQNRKDVYGILTPVIDGKRVFMNARTGEQFAMEAGESETNTIAIGRFVFSQAAFYKAAGIIRDAINKPGWLVIDEVGPLELKGYGFSDVLKTVLQQRTDNILLVVREKEDMLAKVQQAFGLMDAKVVMKIEF